MEERIKVMAHVHTHVNTDPNDKSYWQTITIAKVENRVGKDDSKYYIGDVNPDRKGLTGPPLYFNHKVDLLLLIFSLLAFCVWPSQSWFEIKAKFTNKDENEKEKEQSN